MKARKGQALHLPNGPLIFVLAQVRITPVLSIEEKIPKIQEALRKQGFPRFQTRNIEQKTTDLQGKTIHTEKRKQWEFLDKQNTGSVLLDQDSIVLQVTEYSVFEEFVKPLTIALEAVREIVEPSEVERIGLRYVDLVVPSGEKALDSYFSSSLRGPDLSGAGRRQAFLSESVVVTGPKSNLIFRYAEAEKGLAFPPDLLPLSLKLRRDVKLNTRFGLLDLDHYSQQSNDFSVEGVIDKACELHMVLDESFRNSVTDDAIQEWKQS